MKEISDSWAPCTNKSRDAVKDLKCDLRLGKGTQEPERHQCDPNHFHLSSVPVISLALLCRPHPNHSHPSSIPIFPLHLLLSTLQTRHKQHQNPSSPQISSRNLSFNSDPQNNRLASLHVIAVSALFTTFWEDYHIALPIGSMVFNSNLVHFYFRCLLFHRNFLTGLRTSGAFVKKIRPFLAELDPLFLLQSWAQSLLSRLCRDWNSHPFRFCQWTVLDRPHFCSFVVHQAGRSCTAVLVDMVIFLGFGHLCSSCQFSCSRP